MKHRLNARERQAHRRLCTDHAGLLFDFQTRLRNALCVLARVDPHWLIWLEGVDDSRPLEEITRTVEARTRMFVLKSYPSLNRREIIFSNYPFSNDGNLIMG